MSINKKTRLIIYDKFNGRCAYCGCEMIYSAMQVDHIKPLHRKSTQKELDRYLITKGTNNINNLNPSCKSCNSSKSTFTIENWRKELSLKVSRLMRNVSSFRIAKRFKQIKVTNNDIVFYFEQYNKEKGVDNE